jgi:3-oxochol-4-en-24-oyl-CoA dehydrogenase
VPAGSDHELGAVLRRAFPDLTAARTALDGQAGFNPVLWQRLVQIGIPGLVLPEEAGGADAGLAEAAVAAETLARVATPLPTVAVFLAGLILRGSRLPEAQRLARALAAGTLVVGACLSAADGLPPLTLEREAAGAFVTGEIPDALDASALDVLLLSAGGSWWALDAATPACTRIVRPTLDLTRPLTALTITRGPVIEVSGCRTDGVLAAAWLLLAAEAAGTAWAALDMAAAYARQRHQFGQPIGRFQAIKHKLADDLLAAEGARAAIDVAVHALDADGLPGEVPARMAKAVAGAAGSRVAGDAIQVHGAIGNTWEYDLHLLLRRAKHCELSLGSPDLHKEILADRIIGPRARGPAPNGTGPHGTGPPAIGPDGMGPAGDRARAIQDEMHLDETDRAFVDELRGWLDEHVTAGVLGWLRTADPDQSLQARRDWQNALAEAGLAGIHWPAWAGGRDATIKQQVLYHLEMASRGLPPLIGNRGLSLIGPTLIAHGSPAQRSLLLEDTRRARVLWASGLSEREAGSDLASLRTRGVVDGGDLVVTGHKIWTTAAQYADWLFALVRTDPSAPKHDGITCVLIPLTSAGITIRPIRRITGTADFNEVFLDQVRVPLANVVGDLNDGWHVARTTLSHEHLTNFLGAQMRQNRVVDRIVSRLAGRDVDGGLRRRALDAWINTQLLQALGMRLVNVLGSGHDPGAEGSVLKLFGQEEERRLFELAVDAQGPAGLRLDRWSAAFLSTRASTVGGGTSEIHRNKIAERLLGLPRDPWADDDMPSRPAVPVAEAGGRDAGAADR